DSAAVTVDVTVFVTAENSRPLDNVACVDPDNLIAESNELDNCSDFGSFVAPPGKKSPDLLVSKNVDKLTATPGEDLTYTITIQNIGTAKAKGWDGVSTGLTLTDTLSSEVTFTNANTIDGWTCAEAPVGTVVCHDNGSGMDPNGSTTIKILAHIKDSATAPIANGAVAAPAELDTDCTDPTQCENEASANKLANNQSSVITSVGS